MFVWESLTPRVDYFQYQFYFAPFNESSTIHNTTNSTVTVHDVPFNEIFTFSLTANNCIGESEPVNVTDRISKF